MTVFTPCHVHGHRVKRKTKAIAAEMTNTLVFATLLFLFPIISP